MLADQVGLSFDDVAMLVSVLDSTPLGSALVIGNILDELQNTISVSAIVCQQ